MCRFASPVRSSTCFLVYHRIQDGIQLAANIIFSSCRKIYGVYVRKILKTNAELIVW